jgi:conjugal transfer pilus assembly protein TraB
VATTSGKEAVYAGLGAGVSSALDRLADYYIRLAEQVFPVIEIDAGREIDVVITKGVVVDEAPGAPGEPLGAVRPGAAVTAQRRPDHDEE